MTTTVSVGPHLVARTSNNQTNIHTAKQFEATLVLTESMYRNLAQTKCRWAGGGGGDVDLVARSRGGGAVKALMLEATQTHVVADDIKHTHHLAKDQHPAQQDQHTAVTSGAAKANVKWAGQQYNDSVHGHSIEET